MYPCGLQRGFAPSSCTHKDKDDLLELYYKYACPMPQRKYRINRRGRVMAKSQIMIAKRKRTYEQMKETDESHGRYGYEYVLDTESLISIYGGLTVFVLKQLKKS